MRVKLYTSVSVNGMIARADDSSDFFTDICWHGLVDMARQDGAAVVLGRKTHDLILDWASFQRDLVGTPTRGVVLTRNPDYVTPPSWETAISPEAALEQLGARGIDYAIVAGGTKVYSAFLHEGLVDDITVFVESVVIGAGRPLIPPADLEIPCRLLEAGRLTDSVVRLDYAVVK